MYINIYFILYILLTKVAIIYDSKSDIRKLQRNKKEQN